jgi:vitamin B12 transporter
LFAAGHWLGVEVVYQGQRLDIGNEALAAVTLINLRGAWQWNDAWAVEARVDNLTDRNYEPLVGFNAAGRSLFVALHWRR